MPAPDPMLNPELRLLLAALFLSAALMGCAALVLGQAGAAAGHVKSLFVVVGVAALLLAASKQNARLAEGDPGGYGRKYAYGLMFSLPAPLLAWEGVLAVKGVLALGAPSSYGAAAAFAALVATAGVLVALLLGAGLLLLGVLAVEGFRRKKVLAKMRTAARATPASQHNGDLPTKLG
jgi:hypothetical protein